MKRMIVFAFPLAVALAFAVATRGRAESHATALRGTVGPGFTITLESAEGKPATRPGP
jgi:hypothetical protein